MLLKKLFNMSLDEGLFIGETVILASAILDLVLTFVLPIEFEVNVTTSCGNRECSVGQFNDLFLNVGIIDSFKLGVHLKVSCNDFDCHFNERFYIL